MELMLQDPAVQAAVVGGVCSIAAATIAAIGAVIVGQRFVNQRRLKEKLDRCSGDLAFLLAVEEHHCQIHGQKITIRDEVRASGLTWSGRFTPGRTH